MRVLHVVPDIALETGGQSAAVSGLCTTLASLGLEVSLLTTDFKVSRQRKEDLLSRGVNLNLTPCDFSPWRWSLGFKNVLKTILSKVQIVHLHGLWLYPICTAARYSLDSKIPYLLRPCGMMDRRALSLKTWKKRIYTALFERKTFLNASAIHFTTEVERTGSYAFGSSAPTCVVPLGLSREFIESLPPQGLFRSRFPGLDGREIILFLGRLHFKKHPELLIESFAALVLEFPNASLVLAGPGNARFISHLRAQANRLGLDGRVVFPGLLQGCEVQEALVDADLFVLPSLQENFGLAVVEAMASGCPVVVSDGVALASEIEQYGAGLVVEAKFEPLRDAIRLALMDRKKLHEMGRKGRQLVLERYTWDQVAKDMISVYEDILSGIHTSPAWR